MTKIHIIRFEAYANLVERVRSQTAFYGSAEWKEGPRAIISSIKNDTSIMLEIDKTTLDGLRKT